MLYYRPILVKSVVVISTSTAILNLIYVFHEYQMLYSLMHKANSIDYLSYK